MDFLKVYISQPPWRRDPVSAFQVAFPGTNRITRAYKSALSILNNPQSKQILATLTSEDEGNEGLSRDEQLKNSAYIISQTADSTHERLKAMTVYSSLSTRLSSGKGTKEAENNGVGALIALIGEDSSPVGENVGKRE